MAEKTRNMHRTQVFLPVPLLNWLKAEANSEGVSYAELVRRALDDYQISREMLSQAASDHEDAVAEADAISDRLNAMTPGEEVLYQLLSDLCDQVEHLDERVAKIEQNLT